MFCIVFIFALFSSFSTRSINKPLLSQLSYDKLQNSEDSAVFSTESSDDAAGFFFRPRFGKRDTEETTAETDDAVSAGFFYRPKHGKRAAPQDDEPATVSDDELAGFFMRPKHGKRSAQRHIALGHTASLSPKSTRGFFMKPKVRRSVESATESTEAVTGGFFYRPREGRSTQ